MVILPGRHFTGWLLYRLVISPGGFYRVVVSPGNLVTLVIILSGDVMPVCSVAAYLTDTKKDIMDIQGMLVDRSSVTRRKMTEKVNRFVRVKEDHEFVTYYIPGGKKGMCEVA